MKKICPYCEKEYHSRGSCCSTCEKKNKLCIEFVNARDNLREKCGLERMGFDREECEE